MRCFRIDRTRHRLSAKPGANAAHVDADEIEIARAVHEALNAFASHDARKAESVRLRYFASLAIGEAVDLVGEWVRVLRRVE
jgi:hypothetical protein